MDKILITGGTRGIGKAIALRFAKEGASISFLAKTEVPHPKLAGTLQSVAEEITVAGGKAFPQKVDIRDETALEAAVHKAAQEMGGIDLLINNASAITLLGTEMLPAKQLDLMLDVNIRGTFLTVKFALPYLKQYAASFSDIFLTDEFILKQSGVTDLESYSVQPGTELLPDLFL